MSRCLIVFAKEPQNGNVKTRLKSHLSDAQRINLYKAFLKDTFALVKKIKCESRILAFESAKKDPSYLKGIGKGFAFHKQKGKGLGERMHAAFRYAVRQEYSKIIIIGSDSPTLPPAFIRQAFKELNKNDAVLGPSLDGGFYLIGLKKTCHPVFKGIKWSTRRVLKQALENLRNLHKTVALLPQWFDVDDPSGLGRLKQYLAVNKGRRIAPWTIKSLKI